MLMLFDCGHILVHEGGRLMPLANRELGAETIEMPYGKEGQEDGAIRVLKRDDKGGGGVGRVERWLSNPERELCHLKVAIGGVVSQEGLMAHLVGMSL
jgi:hypothetical protein